MIEIISLTLSGISLILIAVTLIISAKKGKTPRLSSEDKKELTESFNANATVISRTVTDGQKATGQTQAEFFKTFQSNMMESQRSLDSRVMELMHRTDERMAEMNKTQENKLEQIRSTNEAKLTALRADNEVQLNKMTETLDKKLTALQADNVVQLNNMRDTVDKKLTALQADNAVQLDKMRQTVDEKLARTVNERFEQSFKVLSTQLESVYKSLGEMQSVASNVNNLTKVLSNVKTTGIFGEIQLGAILEQMLTSEQYVTNFVTGSGREPVEFAVKLPGQGEGEYVYLPIDSKFPMTVYTDLCNACDENKPEAVKQKREQLKNTIRGMAKDIKNKYIYPPKTTNFAVMFLPVEGLYAEVAKAGLIEELQQNYNVTVAGPTTMSALLNSYQMGFKTLAIQKKSGEVWKILGAVKTEFSKYNELASKIQTRLESASRDFDTLVGTRARMMESKLKSVESLEPAESQKTLGLPEVDNEDLKY
ncbi:MAG: DNA recombination protein RmuC [Candidatus Coproplasma sp.]